MAPPKSYPPPTTPEGILGLELRKERESQNIARVAIAHELGVSESCLSYWERGQRNHRPPLKTFARWADLLGLTLEVRLVKTLD